MSVRGIEKHSFYGDIRFAIAFDSGNGCSLEQRDIYWRTKQEDGTWSEERFLRSFYFDDVNIKYMKNFFRKFVADEAYREECIAKRTDWAIRDALFERNAFRTFWQECPLHHTIGNVPEIYKFIKKHFQQIVTLPEYQRIQALDTQFDPNRFKLDPEIEAAINAFNEIDGVETKFSCQGVSGTVTYQGIEFLTVSPHALYAYITFAQVPETIGEKISEAIETSSTMRYKQLSSASYFSADLVSIGNNLDFRRDALNLAKSLQE